MSEDGTASSQRTIDWGILTLGCGGFHGEDDTISVQMSYETFGRHVQEYLNTMEITAPTYEQIHGAMLHLSQVEYWHSCTDPAVSVKKKGTPFEETINGETHKKEVAQCHATS